MLTVLAPAKLNLTLEVLAERPDGFHEIRSVVQTINLYDSFRFNVSQKLEFKCDRRDWIAEESLVSKAAVLLRETAGYSGGAAIGIDKRIPIASGLGGDSSGAAATLRGLNKLWDLGLPSPKLLELASQLGSDVPFLLYGGTALLKGRGEIVTSLPSLSHLWVVLMIPPVPRTRDKTGRLYASLEAGHYTQGQMTEKLVVLLTRDGGVTPSIPLFNVFEGVAFNSFDGLEGYWEQFLKAGAQEIHLAGSGPTLFTLVKDKIQAEVIHKTLQRHGLESYLAETSTAIDWIG